MTTLKWVVAIFLVFGVIDVCVVRARMAAPPTVEAQPTITAKPRADSVIRTSAVSLLAAVRQSAAEESVRINQQSLLEYMNDKRNVGAQYDGRRVLVTGTATGVFVPSAEERQQVERASSFITMGGPQPRSVLDTLTMPGITAASKAGRTFERSVAVGEQVTLLCTFDHGDANVISLLDCTLAGKAYPTNSGAVTLHGDLAKLPVSADAAPAPPKYDVDKILRSIDDEPDRPAAAPPSQAALYPASYGLERIGGDVSAPVALNNVEAQYSDEARAMRLEGVAMVQMIVDAQGMARKPRLVRGLGHGLDEAALAAVQRYQFRPAWKRGVGAVPVLITVEVNFRLY
jgi:TonB family protein